MEYKKLFTHEELDELVSWFEARREKMPQSLQLDKATYIKDFPTTLGHYMDNVAEHKDNPTYSGLLYHLFLIRDKLIADGME